jgi:predicted NAD/FAD-binding protein
MSAAHTLATAGWRVTLLDRECELGGDPFGVLPFAWNGAVRCVDGAASDYVRSTSRAFDALLDALGVQRRPVRRDVAFMTWERVPLFMIAESGELVVAAGAGAGDGSGSGRRAGGLAGDGLAGDGLAGDGLAGDGLAGELRRFCRDVAARAAQGATVADYLRGAGHGEEFVRVVLRGLCQATFAVKDAAIGELPLGPIAEYWRMHGLVGATPPERVCIVGGMRALCRAFARWLEGMGGELVLSADVYGVKRCGDGAAVRWMDGDGPRQRAFDQVVIALPAPAVATILEDASPGERELFRSVPTRSDRVVVHTDAALLPRDRRAWTACNVVVPAGETDRPASVTFWQNKLADLDPNLPDVLVTLNPTVEPARASLIATRYLLRPVASAASAATPMIRASEAWANVQGRDRVWYCGSYMTAPFLAEQAAVSGLDTAQALIDRCGAGHSDAARAAS